MKFDDATGYVLRLAFARKLYLFVQDQSPDTRFEPLFCSFLLEKMRGTIETLLPGEFLSGFDNFI